MRKIIAQVTTTVLMFATLAVPAYANNGKGNEDHGREFGMATAEAAQNKHEDREDKHEAKFEKHEKTRGEKLAQSACLKTAGQAYKASIRLAEDARQDARSSANRAFWKATDDAWKVRMDARSAARTTYLASAKDEAARTAYAASKEKANTDWHAAKTAAEVAMKTAKETAQATFKTAKEKADADFKIAKDKCTAEVVVVVTTDTTAPSAVANLSLSGATATRILVSWTAPGDDASVGTATTYDIRYSTTSIVTSANFDSATQVVGEPVPTVAGSAQAMTVSGLTAGTTYFFAMKSKDEVPNVSVMSNVPSLLTLGDSTAPSAVTNLSLSGATATSMLVAWTAPGDDVSVGTAASYDIRHSTTAIVTSADFDAATQVVGEPAPTVAGSAQAMTVSGLTTGTTYFFAIKSKDEVPNTSAVSNIVSLVTL